MALRIAPLVLAFLVAAMLQFPTGKAQLQDIDPYNDLGSRSTLAPKIPVSLRIDPSTTYFFQRVGRVDIFCTKNAAEALSAPTFDLPLRLCGSPLTVTRSVNKTAVFFVSVYYPLVGLVSDVVAERYVCGGRFTESPPTLCDPNLPAVPSPRNAAYAFLMKGVELMQEILKM